MVLVAFFGVNFLPLDISGLIVCPLVELYINHTSVGGISLLEVTDVAKLMF